MTNAITLSSCKKTITDGFDDMDGLPHPVTGSAM
jgi:hypothetical protein